MRPTRIQQLENSLKSNLRSKFEKKLVRQEIKILTQVKHLIDFYNVKNYNDYCGVIDGLYVGNFIRNIYKGKYKYFI